MAFIKYVVFDKSDKCWISVLEQLVDWYLVSRPVQGSPAVHVTWADLKESNGFKRKRDCILKRAQKTGPKNAFFFTALLGAPLVNTI